jgi:hypothetical protein
MLRIVEVHVLIKGTDIFMCILLRQNEYKMSRQPELGESFVISLMVNSFFSYLAEGQHSRDELDTTIELYKLSTP